MRRERIKTNKDKKDLDVFYRTIIQLKHTNSKLYPLILTKDGFYLIARTVREVQERNFKPRYNIYDYAAILNLIWEGRKIKDLPIGVPSRIILMYLREAFNELNIKHENYRITLRIIAVSGKLHRISKKYGFDLEYECKYYGIPVLSSLEKY